MNTHFQARVINQSTKAGAVYFVTANADNKPAWYYLQVDELKQKAFAKQMESGDLDLARFGKVLFSGWGTTPPEPIAALIAEEYAAA